MTPDWPIEAGLVVGVLLAGGAGSRFAGPTHKLLRPFRGRPMYRWGVEAILDAGLPAVVVWGALSETPPLPDGVTVLDNPRWAEGMATTLQVAVGHARRIGAEAIVAGPADQPLIPATAWRRVADADGPICVATYAGRRANPVRLRHDVWPLLPLTGDVGARDLMGMRSDLVLEVACPGNPADIDTLEDYERWNWSTRSP